MAWLLRDGEVLAALEVADPFGRAGRGLLGRDGIEGALLLRPARSVHTLGMRFPIDVAFCDQDLRRAADAVPMRRGRHRPARRCAAACVIEAEAGAFDRWQPPARRPARDQE